MKNPDRFDTMNLFSHGPNVPAPGGNSYGFLSAKHTPALWALNARPYISADDAISIFEDVLSATQTYFNHDKKKSFVGENGVRSTHLRAYCELSYYLRALFIKHDQQREFKDSLDDWPWVKFLKAIHESKSVNEVIIVTYNYDLWLEHVLNIIKIPFTYAPQSDSNKKFTIYKPHGSINFIPKDEEESDPSQPQKSSTNIGQNTH
jgi:hypothetical protein